MNSYKVHFEDRFIQLSREPDRLQKYSLFHKFNDTNELYNLISGFQQDKTIQSINIYSPDINHLWKLFRIYFTLVEAAGGLVKHNSGKYLFIERRGKWDLPKGHIEEGEKPEECALREVSEECGINGHKIVKTLTPSYHTYSWEGISYLKKTHWFLMSYEGEMICSPQIEEGILKAVWLYPDEISHIRDSAWLSLFDLINASILKG
ncbi:MAG: NUDIX domain-containing protein [Bacteroidales bacterium]